MLFFCFLFFIFFVSHRCTLLPTVVLNGLTVSPFLFCLTRKQKTIVNNESSEIIEMLNSEFNEFSEDVAEAKALDLFPEEKRDEIRKLNDHVYDNVNNGVYKAGFARKQEAYDEAVKNVFKVLDELEERLAKSRWLIGTPEPTLADVRLFTTLIRFDPVYFGHFKCNLRALTSYPNLWGFTRDFYNFRDVKSTIDIEDARVHYYTSHETINPFRILPIGTKLDYSPSQARLKML